MGDETMTANMTSLIEDAKAAGYEVEVKADGHTTIIKRVGRWKKADGLVIYADGTAVDAAVDLGVAKGLRSYASMRKVLGI